MSDDAADVFTVALSEAEAGRLRDLAREAGLSPEEFLRLGVEEWLGGGADDFAEAAAHVLEKNRELYRRLAWSDASSDPRRGA